MKLLFKRIYLMLPLKKEVYSLLKKVIIPKHSVYKHLHFVDDFEVKIDEDHSFKMRHYGFQIENAVFWKGIYDGWEKVSLQLWGELCSNSNNIVDVGANTGIYSLLAKAVNPAAKVWAFEPVERVFSRLKYNIALNNYDVKCIQKALSKSDGTAIIYDKNTPHTYSVTVNKDISSDKETSVEVEIKTLRLDTYIEHNNIENIELMKIDVETHEPEVLEGMGKYLEQFQPTLLIEILNEEVAEKISNMIAGMGYEYYNLDEKGLIHRASELSKSDYFNFLICKPEVAIKLKTIKKYLVE